MAILWRANLERNNAMGIHVSNNPNAVSFSQSPNYGSPPENGLFPYEWYGPPGDGSLLDTVNTVTRGEAASFRMTCKNSVNGSEPTDCDTGSGCSIRRVELPMGGTIPDYYNAIGYQQERWLSASYYIPSDWIAPPDTDWGPIVAQFIPRNINGAIRPTFAIYVELDSWRFVHRTSTVENPAPEDVPNSRVQQWTANSREQGGVVGTPVPVPSATIWADGLQDYPDTAASQSMMQVVKGQWTDIIINIRTDARTAGTGGTGYIDLWMRVGAGAWVHVLNILPRNINVSGSDPFDRGIWYNCPAGTDNNGGFGFKAGLYMPTDQVWNDAHNRVINIANLKIGDENSTFSDMSHDGTTV